MKTNIDPVYAATLEAIISRRPVALVGHPSAFLVHLWMRMQVRQPIAH